MSETYKVLERNDFKCTKETKKANEFTHIETKNVIYTLPSQCINVVLNPKLVDNNIFLKQQGEKYHNTALSCFPKEQHTGKRPIHYGYQFKFKTIKELEVFLLYLKEIKDIREDDQLAQEISLEIAPIEAVNDIDTTEKFLLIKTRVGHGALKKKLLQKECECKICGLSDERFLIASHIKPWAESNNQERLDLDNAFLLCPHHDAAFDKGYISFNEQGELLISSELTAETRLLLNIIKDDKVNLTNKNKGYLKWHRENKFKN